MKVHVEREYWRFGGDSVILSGACGRTQLLNDRGFQDILGFVAFACGVSYLKLHKMDTVYSLRAKHGIVLPYLQPNDASCALAINDRPLKLQTPQAKEDELTDFLGEFCFHTVFTGKYHHAVLEEMEETRYDV